MSREIPEPVRAAAGLAATVLDEVRKLPETLPGLPVRAVGLAMQAALKLQQEYAGLVARGDELFTGIRGEHEPGLATFDDDEDAAPAPATTPPGFRDSAFDRTEAPPVDAIGDTGRVEQALEDAALEEIAIDDLVDASDAAGVPAGVDADAGALENALLESEGEVTPTGDAAPAVAPRRAPVDGYDGFSIAQLRGRLRGYALSTVEELLAYEQATRAREPYLRMLRNRLERLTAEAVESSPLAPRGA